VSYIISVSQQQVIIAAAVIVQGEFDPPQTFLMVDFHRTCPGRDLSRAARAPA